MLCMHQKSCKLIFVQLQSEQHTKTHIVNATLHCPIHSLCVVVIVVLWTCWVEFFVAFLVICFLKQNVCSYSCIFQFFVIFNCCGGNIHIHSAYFSVFMVYGIYSFNALQNIFNRVIYRVLPRLNGKSFVTHILEGNHLIFNLFLSQLFTRYVLVLHMIRAVNTPVHTVVGKIERCKYYYSVSVILLLNLPCKVVHLLDFFFVLTGKKN